MITKKIQINTLVYDNSQLYQSPKRSYDKNTKTITESPPDEQQSHHAS